MPIKTLLLDAGGTIVFPNFRRIADEFARDGVVVDLDRLAQAEARVRFELDRAEVVRSTADADRWARHLENLLRAAGVEHAPAGAIARLKAYHDEQNLWEYVPPDVPGALDALAGRYRLGIVSNANGTVRWKLTRLGLAHRFEVIVDSLEEGVEKPDPRIFRIAMERMGVGAGETAYVGDLYHVDIVGARAAGLRAFLIDPRGLHTDKDCERIASLTDILR